MDPHSIYVFDIGCKKLYDNNRRWFVMTDMENRVNLNAYKEEVKDVLQRLVKTMPAYKELRFFVECVSNHNLTDLEKDSSDIVVIGSNISDKKNPAVVVAGPFGAVKEQAFGLYAQELAAVALSA
jgi:hypothetical protein